MPVGYWISVTTHLIAAFTWLGGMFFLGLVGAPVLRAIEPASLRQRLFQDLGLRFRAVGWIAIATLVVTGTFNLHYRGLLHWSTVLANAAFWETSLGRALAAKLGIVVIMVGVGAVHDFVLGPAAGRVDSTSIAAQTLRRNAAWLARVNAVAGLGLIVAAMHLTRGG